MHYKCRDLRKKEKEIIESILDFDKSNKRYNFPAMNSSIFQFESLGVEVVAKESICYKLHYEELKMVRAAGKRTEGCNLSTVLYVDDRHVQSSGKQVPSQDTVHW
jgi:hypothetical protein